ncbi:unnamed protein product [Larinioides sclopetarius]|uniref:Peptidase M12A domain-containing protein n=1 Tax=Larinioides sclopetarius TaxID=280406 RepID=A0AAV1Z332_9ARAC
MKLLVLLGVLAAASADSASLYDPMINEGLFEGDILLDPNADRNAIPRDSQRWPGGVVPYFISPELGKTYTFPKVICLYLGKAFL